MRQDACASMVIVLRPLFCGLTFHRLRTEVARGFVQPTSIQGPHEAMAVGALL